VLQTQKVQVNQKPLDLFLLSLGLIRFKGANVKLRDIHQFIVGLLKEIKHEL
jgi:hypothetical protein